MLSRVRNSMIFLTTRTSIFKPRGCNQDRWQDFRRREGVGIHHKSFYSLEAACLAEFFLLGWIASEINFGFEK